MSPFRLIHSIVNVPFIKRMITSNRSLVRIYFNWKYRQEDPYGLSESEYEKEKLSRTAAMAAPYGRFAAILEIGCGEGPLTAMLAPLGDSVLGVDISDTAVSRARERLAGLDNVQVERVDILADRLDGLYDLVAASEVLYYLDREQLPGAAERISALVRPGGMLLLAHARALADDESGVELKKFGAATIHTLFINDPSFQVTDDNLEPEYRITLLRKKGVS